MMAWAQAGVGLPHSSSAQFGVGPHVSSSDLQPGDLVFYYSPISHVAHVHRQRPDRARRQPRRGRPRGRCLLDAVRRRGPPWLIPGRTRRDRTRGPVVPRRWVAGLRVLVVVLAAGGVTWALVRRPAVRRPAARAAAPQPRPGRRGRRGPAGARRRARPPVTRTAAAGPGARGRPGGGRDLLRAVVAQRRALGIVDARPALRRRGRAASTPTGRWAAAVDATWRFDGFDSGTALARGGDWSASSPSAGRRGRRSPGSAAAPAGSPVLARRSGRGPRAPRDPGRGRRRRRARRSEADRYAAPGRRPSCPSCAGCCRDWRGRLVVEVPDSSAALDRALDAEPGHYAAHRGRHRVGGRLDRHRLAGARLRQPGRLRRLRADRGAGRDQPRGHPRRDRTPLAATCRCGCSRGSPTTSRCATSTCR